MCSTLLGGFSGARISPVHVKRPSPWVDIEADTPEFSSAFSGKTGQKQDVSNIEIYGSFPRACRYSPPWKTLHEVHSTMLEPRGPFFGASLQSFHSCMSYPKRLVYPSFGLSFPGDEIPVVLKSAVMIAGRQS